jgi:hypothetical protein
MVRETPIVIGLVALAVILWSALRFAPVPSLVRWLVLFGVGLIGPGVVVAWLRSREA